MLYELVAQHAQTSPRWRATDPEGGGLPRYVERELTAYLRCGVLAHGFARVRCTTYHDEIVVAFSCRRGLCPSCTARRMADTAAYLVDRVLPSAPYRQWVFTVPKALRLRLARDPAWATWVGNLAVRAIGAWQRRVARKRGLRARRPERSHSSKGSAAWSTGSVHFHLLVPDGVFIADEDRLAFALHPVPTSADVVAILDRIVRGSHRQESDLDGRGRGSARRVREPPTVRFSSRGMHGADARAPPSRRGRISIDRLCDRTSFVAACHRGVPSRVGARGDSSRLRTREEWQMGNRCLPGDLNKAFL